MAESDMSDESPLAAGPFSPWVIAMQGAIRGHGESDVPCDGCTACCTSSQFVHIGPDERDTLSHIPAELLFPAPQLPQGHVLLGYDERGHCPMLIDNACSIYEHRPRTCRTYDCRVFPATGIAVDGDDSGKALIAQRARRWQFELSTEADREHLDAVRAAATFLDEHGDVLPEGAGPINATQHAVLAIDIHDTFLRREADPDREPVIDPDPDVVRVEIMRRTRARPPTSTAPTSRGR